MWHSGSRARVIGYDEWHLSRRLVASLLGDSTLRSIRVETSAATILLTEAPETKIKDRQTGEIATDTATGETLMTVGVVYIEDGESSLVKVTIPQSGVSEGLALGAPVALPGLVARPWESTFNGQQRHGIAFRAAAVTSSAFPAQVGA